MFALYLEREMISFTIDADFLPHRFNLESAGIDRKKGNHADSFICNI